LTKTTNSH